MTRAEDLKDGRVRFKCTRCTSIFGFNWPQPPGVTQIEGQLEQAPKFEKGDMPPKASPTVNTTTTMVKRECVNCKKTVSGNLKECPHCGVIFDKVRNIKSSFASKVSPEMTKAWEKVKENYQDPAKHEDFVQVCLKKGNLVFASQQYAKLLESAPQDELAQKMQQRVVELASITYLASQEREDPKTNNRALGWTLGIGSVLILIGLTSSQARPMIAVGAMIVVFVVALKYLQSP